MSSLGIPTLSNLLGGLLTQLPVLAVLLVGVLLAVTRWSRHPRASALLLAGLAIQLVMGLLGLGLSAVLPWLVGSIPGARVGVILQLVTIVRSLISAVGWGLVLAAVFADRGERERR